MDNREILRRLWISEKQDQHQYASDDTMREIIEEIDSIITQLTDDQVDSLL
jgi:hypothetical protein